LGGHRVVLTRNADHTLSLGERAAMARSVGAPVLFVSLHSNWGYAGERGPETWVHSQAGAESVRLAQGIQGQLASLGSGDRGVHRGPLAVLEPRAHHPAAAACMVEADFLSDQDGARRLQDPHELDRISHAIASGILGHLSYGTRYGTTEVAVGSGDWQGQLRTAFQAGGPVVLRLDASYATDMILAVVRMARDQGWQLLTGAPEAIAREIVNRFPAIREGLERSIGRAIDDIVGTLSSWWRSLTQGQGYQPPAQGQAMVAHGQALPAVAVVAIVLIVAIMLAYGVRQLLQYLTDLAMQETLRHGVDNDYEVVEVVCETEDGSSVTVDEQNGTVGGLRNCRVRLERRGN
ncbi:MAG: N-acetylmuramoyl-L-alanine amidase, partial [Myxococcales bacterium]|nr:N-acetylmuramoyl-L-alanine amidase [Myxococcales bacterium]